MLCGATRYPSALDATAIEYARNYLNEIPNKQQEFVIRLREYFSNNEPKVKLSPDDDILVAFLRGSKYDFERCVYKLKNYYTMRTELPAIFSNRDPLVNPLHQALRLGFFVPLRRLQDGRLVIIIRPAAYNPRKFTLEEVLKVGYVILDVCSKICPMMLVYGVCAIFDMQDISLGHVRPITPSIIKHMVNSWENYYCRPKQLEFINAPLYINVILNVFKSFMSQKLKERVKVHYGGSAALHEFIDPEVLPEEYGGIDGPLQNHTDYWAQEITKWRDWLICDEEFKVVE